MVVTIVCRDTINCKVTIVLCNGAQVLNGTSLNSFKALLVLSERCIHSSVWKEEDFGSKNVIPSLLYQMKTQSQKHKNSESFSDTRWSSSFCYWVFMSFLKVKQIFIKVTFKRYLIIDDKSLPHKQQRSFTRLLIFKIRISSEPPTRWLTGSAEMTPVIGSARGFMDRSR